MDEAATIPKRVAAMRPDDLARVPNWEFALDEEVEEGQDEETVKPRPDLTRADPAVGIFVVRAEFGATDGTRFDGDLSPHEDAHASYTQPTIVTADGQVRFWPGGVPPRPGALDSSYRTMG